MNVALLIFSFWLGFFFCAGLAALAFIRRVNLALGIATLAMVGTKIYLAFQLGDLVIIGSCVIFGVISLGVLFLKRNAKTSFIFAAGGMGVALILATPLLLS